VSVGALLELLAEVGLYMWLLSGVAAVTVPGQLLGTVWGLPALAVPVAAGRTVRELRHRLRAGTGDDAGTGVASPPPYPAGPRRRRRANAVAAIAGFAVSVAAANWLTSRYGFIPVGLGLSATAGTYAAGLCLLARDWEHDTAGRVAVLAAIAAGGLASAVMAGPRLALASAVAFVASEVADLLVYQPLRRRGWVRAVVASNGVGAPVDTILFLALAGFPIWAAVPGQLLAKMTATAIPVTVVLLARALLRHRVRPEGA
jgi:queuosine precursor transporter